MPFPSKTNKAIILSTATEIVERDGIDELSVREVAKRLKLAPNALYHYFKDKSELEGEIAAEGYRRLHRTLKRSSDGKVGIDAVVDASLSYLKFARTNPEIYKIMFKKHEPFPVLMQAIEENRKFGQKLYAWIEPEETAAEAQYAIFALLHGIAALERDRILEDDSLKREPTVAIRALIAGLAQPKSN